MTRPLSECPDLNTVDSYTIGPASHNRVSIRVWIDGKETHYMDPIPEPDYTPFIVLREWEERQKRA